MKNLVSFIVVAYNAEDKLEYSLGSLIKQDYPHSLIEVILVDSVSNDGTKLVFKKFKKKYKNEFKQIVIFDNPKRILPCGWNIALKNATGDFILRVDAHSFFDENFISNNVKEICNNENIVGGKCISVIQKNNWKEKLLLIAEESIFGCGIADFRRKEKKEYVSTLAFAMYRKKVFDDVGLYNENLARTEDNEMHYRMKKSGYKFLLSPNIKSYRYVRSNLRQMIKQKYGNGKWIGVTMYYCPKCFSIYHFVPLLFVLGILFSLIMYIMNIPIFIFLLLVSYLLFNLLNVLLITIKNGFHLSYLLLPIIFFMLHFAYGFGTIIGLIKGLFIKGKKN